MTVEIITGDCRTAALGGPHDACVTDPPYGDTSLQWDTIVGGWLPAVAAALKPNASIWVFGSLRFLAPLFGEMAAQGFRYSQDIVWEKQNGTGFHNDRFRRVHEHAAMFYRGAWADVYHEPQFTNDATARVVRKKERAAHWTGKTGSTTYISEDGGPRLERSVQKIRNEHSRAITPTQKPLELLQKLIRYSVPPNGSVLDVFGGSCSTAMAARIEGRACTCVEIDPATSLLARNWLGNGPLFVDAQTQAAAA